MDIEGVSVQADFEVIEIFNEKNLYVALLGIDWATDMKGVINLKKYKMIFKKKTLCIVVPLDQPKERDTLNWCTTMIVKMISIASTR